MAKNVLCRDVAVQLRRDHCRFFGTSTKGNTMTLHRTILVAVFCSACLCAAVPVPAEEGPLNLSLNDAIKLAAENNLDVKVELYNPAMAEADIRGNSGIYDTLLNALANYNNSTTVSSTSVITGTGIVRQKSLELDAGASQLLPTGGTVAAGFNNIWYRNNFDPARSLTDYYQSELALSLNQPLLKNFGRENTELAIKVAGIAKESSLETLKTRLNAVIAQVLNDYLTLYRLRQDLEVKRISLALAQRILADTQGRVKAGVLPAMEILNAEFGVATREKDIIDAQRTLSDQMDRIRVLLQLKEYGEIIPADLPTRDEFQVKEDEALTLAFATRPELQAQRAGVKNRELQTRALRNRTLPDLALKSSVSLTSLDRSYAKGLDHIGSADYPVWGVGLQFSYPLGNRAAENEYIKSKLALEQTQTRLSALESNIANEVRTSIRGIRASYKQLEVTDRGTAFAEERLNAFIKKNQAGLATTKDVLDVETDLVTAKNNQVRALVDYNNAITTFLLATGQLLDKYRIRVDEQQGDALYHQAGR